MQENKKQIYSKLVYIHELDSVRSSEAEIKHARSRLYEEILINGNTPVISFNQLADSKAFIGLVIGATGQLTATDNDNSDFSDIGYRIPISSRQLRCQENQSAKQIHSFRMANPKGS